MRFTDSSGKPTSDANPEQAEIISAMISAEGEEIELFNKVSVSCKCCFEKGKSGVEVFFERNLTARKKNITSR